MEFGATNSLGITYYADVKNTSRQELDDFVERASWWMTSHGITPGEGFVRTHIADGFIGYVLTASLLAGPENVRDMIVEPGANS